MSVPFNLAPGIILCILIASAGWFLGNLFPVIGGPVFGILFGIIISAILPQLPPDKKFDRGIKYSSKKVLQYSIILLGFEMNLFQIAKVGTQSLLIIFTTLTTAFLTAYLVGKFLKIHGKMTTLIGVGTAICGGSAIAATAPVIQAKEEDITHAISTIFLFNVIAVFIFPALGHWLKLTDTGFGMWSGTAINDTSSVVAAATSWSNSAGNNTALGFATIVKLTRTLMIVPIVFALAIYTAKNSTKNPVGKNFKLTKVFPWFIIGFILAALINTFLNLPHLFTQNMVEISKFMIIMAMVAIGLNTNIKKLISNGLNPILLGLCCWFAVASISLLIQHAMNIW